MLEKSGRVLGFVRLDDWRTREKKTHFFPADGNPVTGTGYASEAQKNGPVVQNGIASSNSSSSGEKSSDTSPMAKQPTRTRVPPGGYSSGLW